VNQPRIIELIEYQPAWLEASALPEEVGQQLWRRYGKQVEVETPSFKNGQRWRLTSQGWVGHIPLTPQCHFVLQPKVALTNLFRMLDYAYRFNFETSDDLIASRSLAEFYERLAHILARRILERGRKGFYRAYLSQSESSPYLRGRLDIPQMMRTPEQVRLACHYQEQTADVEENQILVWTLWQIARSGLCTERVLPTVRQAYYALQGLATLQPYSAAACLGRLYNRLNDDYQPLHALCRFFLEQSGPTHHLGDRTMLPFLVNMAHLYELFVAEWLKQHLRAGLRLQVQERVNLGESGGLHFQIDLVLYDVEHDVVRCVLDTKYQAADRPAAEDIQQMISYAHTKGCSEAILVYPAPLAQPFDETIRGIRVRSLAFALEGDLEQAGRTFIASLALAEYSNQ
jgi:5-methylcytosine-specific restriction enzyme subunit McrC